MWNRFRRKDHDQKVQFFFGIPNEPLIWLSQLVYVSSFRLPTWRPLLRLYCSISNSYWVITIMLVLSSTLPWPLFAPIRGKCGSVQKILIQVLPFSSYNPFFLSDRPSLEAPPSSCQPRCLWAPSIFSSPPSHFPSQTSNSHPRIPAFLSLRDTLSTSVPTPR